MARLSQRPNAGQRAQRDGFSESNLTDGIFHGEEIESVAATSFAIDEVHDNDIAIAELDRPHATSMINSAAPSPRVCPTIDIHVLRFERILHPS